MSRYNSNNLFQLGESTRANKKWMIRTPERSPFIKILNAENDMLNVSKLGRQPASNRIGFFGIYQFRSFDSDFELFRCLRN